MKPKEDQSEPNSNGNKGLLHTNGIEASILDAV